MENLRAKFMKWRRTSTHKYSRIEEFPDQLLDAEQTILKKEEESVKYITYASQSGSKSTHLIILETQLWIMGSAMG